MNSLQHLLGDYAQSTRNSGLLYVAGPYTPNLKGSTPAFIQNEHGNKEHSEAFVRRKRFEAFNEATAFFMKQGFVPFSPITHSHVIAEQCDTPTTWDFWKKQDLTYLRNSMAIVGLRMNGWDQSVGLCAEMDMATELGIPRYWVDPENVIEEYVNPLYALQEQIYTTHHA